jgi:hypothetical protein
VTELAGRDRRKSQLRHTPGGTVAASKPCLLQERIAAYAKARSGALRKGNSRSEIRIVGTCANR